MSPRHPEPTPPRLIVCAVAGQLAAVRRELAAAGWTIRPSLEVAPSPWVRNGSSDVCTALVTSPEQIAEVAELLSRGISVAVEVPAKGLAADLYDQCARLGFAEWHDEVHPPMCTGLDEVQIGLLQQLSGGAGVVAAARSHHLSERTAARRLASAREQLGCRTTAEAAAKVGAHLARRRPPA